MPEFKLFREELNAHIKELMKNNQVLFVVNVDKDILWNTYLDSFPEGANTIFRERREYDCAACRSFIKHFGHVVETRLAERKAAEDSLKRKEQKQKILQLISDKQDEELRGKTIEDLTKMLDEM